MALFPPGDNLTAGTGAGEYPLPSLNGTEHIPAWRAASAYANYTTPVQITGLPADSVSLKQIKQALANVSSATIWNVQNAILADISTTVNIIWTSGGQTELGDDLYVLIQATLSYTTNQMLALYLAASVLPK